MILNVVVEAYRKRNKLSRWTAVVCVTHIHLYAIRFNLTPCEPHFLFKYMTLFIDVKYKVYLNSTPTNRLLDFFLIRKL